MDQNLYKAQKAVSLPVGGVQETLRLQTRPVPLAWPCGCNHHLLSEP